MQKTIYLDTVKINKTLSEDIFVGIDFNIFSIGVYSENKRSEVFGVYSY